MNSTLLDASIPSSFDTRADHVTGKVKEKNVAIDGREIQDMLVLWKAHWL